MNKNLLKLSEGNLQPSILGFVDKPSNGSSINRLPRATKRSEIHPSRSTSSASKSRKCKISAVDNTDTNSNTEKIQIMEPLHEDPTTKDSPKPTPTPNPTTSVNDPAPEDSFTRAL